MGSSLKTIFVGVLINNRYVLTARYIEYHLNNLQKDYNFNILLYSHCVNGKDLPPTWTLSTVRLGEWDTATAQDCDDSFTNEKICLPPAIGIPIEEQIPHPNYDPFGANQHNDIALLRLAQDVQYTDYIKPICLPTEPTVRNNDFVKQVSDK